MWKSLRLSRLSSLSFHLRWLLALFTVAQIADWLTTEVFLRLGVTEANPLAQSLVTHDLGLAGLTVKLTLIILVALFVGLFSRFAPRMTLWALVIMVALPTFAVSYNVLLIILALAGFH